jgi:hypothetical protein
MGTFHELDDDRQLLQHVRTSVTARRAFRIALLLSLGAAACRTIGVGAGADAGNPDGGGEDLGAGGDTAADDAGAPAGPGGTRPPAGTGGAGVAGSGGARGGGGSGGAGAGTGSGGRGGAGAAGGSCGSPSTTPLRPEVLLLLDKSSSLLQRPDGSMCPTGSDCVTKWSIYAPAVKEVVAATVTEVDWGLKLFPSGASTTAQCQVSSTVEIPMGPGNGAAIAAAIDQIMPYGSTPTRLAETFAATYLQTFTTANPKAIVLATEGQPNCGSAGSSASPDDAATIEAVRAAAAAGIRTFVMGWVLDSDLSARATLSEMALVGGTARNADPPFYPAGSGAELATALRQLGVCR